VRAGAFLFLDRLLVPRGALLAGNSLVGSDRLCYECTEKVGKLNLRGEKRLFAEALKYFALAFSVSVAILCENQARQSRIWRAKRERSISPGLTTRRDICK
jgi:hypothetical protein